MTEEEFIGFCASHYYDEEDIECARKIVNERPDVTNLDWIHAATCEMMNSKFGNVDLSVNDALEYTEGIRPFAEGYIEKNFPPKPGFEKTDEEFLEWFAEWLANDHEDEEEKIYPKKGQDFDAYVIALNALADQIAKEDHCIVVGKAVIEPNIDHVSIQVAVTSPVISDRAKRLLKYAENLCDNVKTMKKYRNPFYSYELEIGKPR